MAEAPDAGREYRWVNVTMAAPFAPRDGAGALVAGGRLWLIGGWNPSDKQAFPSTCTNDVWSSSNGAEWMLEKPNTYGTDAFDSDRDWEGRHTAGVVVHDDRMWIVGGDCLQGHYQDDVWCSDDGRAWRRVGGECRVPWHTRVLHHTLAFRGRIWVFGGQTLPQYAPAEERFFRDAWCSADGAAWERVSPVEPFWAQRGMIGGSAVLGGRMWVLGGGTYDTPQTPERRFFNDVWSSDDGVRWDCHTVRAPWAPRQYHEVAVFDGKLWVMEGFNRGGNRNDVWYSSDGTNWTEVPGTPWAPRHAASVFVFDEALWIVAGNNMQSDVWKLVRAGGPAQGKALLGDATAR